jgi:hypothetical protein
MTGDHPPPKRGDGNVHVRGAMVLGPDGGILSNRASSPRPSAGHLDHSYSSYDGGKRWQARNRGVGGEW